jgi:hypothetical protein
VAIKKTRVSVILRWMSVIFNPIKPIRPKNKAERRENIIRKILLLLK